MRTLFIIPLVLVSLVSFPSWGLTMDDLVTRDGLYYEKFTDVPFTGEIDEGLARGSFRNGKKDGPWKHYYNNGQLLIKGEYQNGDWEGYWERYWDNGQLWQKGYLKHGKSEGFWISYHSDGKLMHKGNYKNGKREGSWEAYWHDGSVDRSITGTFKNGVKVSD